MRAAHANSLAAVRLHPPADVNLGVGLAAVVACMWSIGGFLGPLEDGQLFVAAVDHDPADGILALFAAYLTSINFVDHSRASMARRTLSVHCSLSTVPYSSICRSSGSTSMQSMARIGSSARLSAEDLHGSTVTTNGSALAG